MRVKVDDGTEANILPLDYFRTMFPHALDRHMGIPKQDSWTDPRSTLNVMMMGG